MVRLGILVAAGALCAMAGAASAAPALEATCPNVQYRGPVIVATCYTAAFQLVRTSIDTRGCVGPVQNFNGQLNCPRGGGGYGGPGYGGPRGGAFGGPRPRYYDEDD